MTHWLIDWLTDWLIDKPTDWVIDQLIIIDSLPEYGVWRQQKEERYFAFTTQPNTLKGWGMGALVSQAQDRF